MKRPSKTTIAVLCDLLEWAKGNRGSKSGNPYLIPEIKAALKHIADLQGISSYLDATTTTKEKKTMKDCAYSIKTTRVKEPDFPYDGRQLTCTQELVAFAKELQNSDIEKMLCLYLDAQNKLICLQIITGTINQCIIYPREVFRHALLVGACNIILIHNHPSSMVRPSDSDIRLTNNLITTGKILDLAIHDHLIIGGDKYLSMREDGLIDFN